MENSEKNDFPTGSSGGGGKRGYGVKSFLHPTGEESPSNEDTQNSDNKIDDNCRDQPAPSEQNVESNWIEELDSVRVVRENLNQASSASSISTDLESTVHVNDEGSDKSDDLNEESGEHLASGPPNYAGYQGNPNIHGGFRLGAYVGPAILGHGVLALKLNGSNAAANGPAIANGGNLGGISHSNNSVAQNQGQVGIGGIHVRGREIDQNMIRNNHGLIFYYATTTAYAYRRLNADVLSEMFSLRDAHIFNIINVMDYAGAISQICSNEDLSIGMINHIDCFKALLARDIPRALSNQISCVNAVMRLVNQAYGNHEDWSIRFIQTVDYDLRIISDRASNRGCRSRAIIRYDWSTNRVLCYLHPEDCKCHQAKNK